MRLFAIAAILALMAAASPEVANRLFDPQGYRSASYRAPVDRDPAPARRIFPAEARRLVPGRTALFVDVLPAEGAQRDPVSGSWALAAPHQTIAGAIWLPETGRASPEPLLWSSLVGRVAKFRHRRPAAPVVVFCRVDCWMSWNAARRLASGGVRDVRWFSEGIEGWREAGGALADSTPEPTPPSRQGQ